MSVFVQGVELETRKDVFIRTSKIAGFIALKERGPTRVLFDGGGFVDVTGAASHWELIVRIMVSEGAANSEENAA